MLSVFLGTFLYYAPAHFRAKFSVLLCQYFPSKISTSTEESVLSEALHARMWVWSGVKVGVSVYAQDS